MSSSYAAIIRIQNLLDVDLTHDPRNDRFDNECSVTGGSIPEIIRAGTTEAAVVVQPPKEKPSNAGSGILGYKAKVNGTDDAETEVGFGFTAGRNSVATVTSQNPERFSSRISPYSSSDTPLEVTYTIYPALEKGLIRPPRGIGRTTTIRNNSQNTVYCIMNSRGSEMNGKALAYTSLLLAFAGFPLVPLTQTASWTVAILGALVAVAGVGEVEQDPSKAEGIIVPGDSMSHTSYSGTLWGSNDVLLLQTEIKEKVLTIQYCSKGDVGEETLSILSLQFSTIFKIQLDTDMELRTYRSLRIDHLKPMGLTPGKPPTKPEDSVIYAESDAKGIVEYFPTSFPKNGLESDNSSAFEYIADNHGLIITQVPQAKGNFIGDYEIMPLGNRDVVLRLYQFIVDSKVDGDGKETKPNEEEETTNVISFIRRNHRNIFVFDYIYKNQRGYVRSWSHDKINTIKRSWQRNSRPTAPAVYFYVPNSRVMERQFLVPVSKGQPADEMN